MTAEVPLDRLQRWMQQVVVHPGTVEEGLSDAGTQGELPRPQVDEVILPSRALAPGERVGIYHGMYLLRMEEALASDYPGLKHFLGEHRFSEMVRGYVQEHPSRHFSLNHLGDHLPEYVARVQGLPRPAFCTELARMELALTHVFDAPETPPLGAEEIEAMPAEAWEGVRLRPVAAFRLLALRYPVAAYLDSLKEEDHRHPPLRRQDTWVAVYRRDYSVWRLTLERPAHDLLADLVAGMAVGAAVSAALRRGGRARRRLLPDDLFRWFRSWVAAGLFATIERTPP